jgi:hypothetical protein
MNVSFSSEEAWLDEAARPPTEAPGASSALPASAPPVHAPASRASHQPA